MRHKRLIASLMVLAGAAPATQALGQSNPQLTDDPAELFGYSVDVRETESRRVAEQALDALEQAGETAQEIKMVFGVNRFHFVVLRQDSIENIVPELAKREADVSSLRTAIESSALFYTAMRSEGVSISKVIGVELADAESGLSSEQRVTVYLMP